MNRFIRLLSCLTLCMASSCVTTDSVEEKQVHTTPTVMNSYDRRVSMSPLDHQGWVQTYRSSADQGTKLIALLGTKQFEESIQAAKKALAKTPYEPKALKTLMFSWAMQNNYQMALYYAKLYEKKWGRTADTSNIEGLNHLFGTAGKHKEYQKAEKAFRVSQQLQPNHIASALNLGYLQMELNRYDDARDTFRHLRQVNPECIEASYAYAMAMSHSGFPDISKQILESLLTNHPDHIPSLLHLAILELEVYNNQEKSSDHLRDVLGIENDSGFRYHKNYAEQILKSLDGVQNSNSVTAGKYTEDPNINAR